MEKNMPNKRPRSPGSSGQASTTRTEKDNFVFYKTSNFVWECPGLYKPQAAQLPPWDWFCSVAGNCECVPGFRYFAEKLFCKKVSSCSVIQKAGVGVTNIQYFWPKFSHNLTNMFSLEENLQYIGMFFKSILMLKSSSELQCKPKTKAGELLCKLDHLQWF